MSDTLAQNTRETFKQISYVPLKEIEGFEKYETSSGVAAPLGSTVYPDGVNFSLFSNYAQRVQLWLFASPEDDLPVQVVELDPVRNKSFQYWHVFVRGARPGLCYGYKVYGDFDPEKGLYFDGSKLLSDPFALALYGKHYSRERAIHFGRDNTKYAIKSVVVGPDDYDWEGDTPLKYELSKSVIYEMHVAGFTRHPNSGLPEELRGTFLGLIEKIPYLRSLGITTVELMPVFAFDPYDAPRGLENYWGYSPVSFFAPHWGYGSTDDPLETIREFKDMVKALHKAGIEVILDVVYNHTAEGFMEGPWLNMKGQAPTVYYIQDSAGHFANYSGCGNTINTNAAVTRRMIRNSLRYWVEHMHVDGFRFDLASVLTRGGDGKTNLDSPVVNAIEMDPVLASTKLIAEAWDAAGLYQLGFFAGRQQGDCRWAEWNGAYRDDIRRFIRGDERMIPVLAARVLGSKDIYNSPCGNINQSIHFVSCHDGFTMNDVVSYNHKHNLANKEDNRDGLNENYSWNCGVEGPSDDPSIRERRIRRIKNFFATLFFTQGTPMFVMGDEIQRTQLGNNNAYCQNNEISWFDWEGIEKNREVLDFARGMIDLSQRLSLFSLEDPLHVGVNDESPYVLWHGVHLNEPDWSAPSRSIAMELFHPQTKEHLYAVFNMYWGDLTFELPPLMNRSWRLAVDTARAAAENFRYGEIREKSIVVARNSVLILTDPYIRPSR